MACTLVHYQTILFRAVRGTPFFMVHNVVQVREQAKALLQRPEDHVQGLNLINSTNLDYFQPQHQAEMINLKAQFFAALGDGDTGEESGHMCIGA